MLLLNLWDRNVIFSQYFLKWHIFALLLLVKMLLLITFGVTIGDDVIAFLADLKLRAGWLYLDLHVLIIVEGVRFF